MATSLPSVTLSVEFAGLCLYVIDRRPQGDTRPEPEETVVRVLMPTCVPTASGSVSTTHEDGTIGERHVAYLLMDMASLDPGPTVPPSSPRFQVVRRLMREEVVFDPGGSIIRFIPPTLPLPDLSFYKPDIKLKDDQLSGTPPASRVELNARTILRGGTLTATSLDGTVGKPHATWHGADEAWAGSIIWTQQIPTDNPELTRVKFNIRDWATDTLTPITLKPVKRTVDNATEWVIALKIANLCETNPLEWVEFEHRLQKDDVDFKWLYRLFNPSSPAKHPRLIDVFGGPGRNFPYPKLAPRAPRTTGSTGCTGGQFGLP